MSFKSKGNGSLRLTLPDPSSVVRPLYVTDDCPLYFRTEGAADSKRSPIERTFYVKPGTFELHAQMQSWFAVVTMREVRVVSESEALMALGAFDKLVALGLEDAAVSVMVGELLFARNQWVRWRYG
jgi:hypothetical protein